MMIQALMNPGRVVFLIIVSVITFMGLFMYPGNKLLYFTFSLISNFYLLYSFRSKALFFEGFLAVFVWLGFWIKLSYKIIFNNTVLTEKIYRYFSGEIYIIDDAILITIIAMLAALLVSLLREILCSKNFGRKKNVRKFNSGRYLIVRPYVLILFPVVCLLVGFFNFKLGIYQRGSISETTLPYGLNGVFTWLLMFGLTSFSTIILYYEMLLKKKQTIVPLILFLFEVFVSSVSMLSRAMVINFSAVFWGFQRYLSATQTQINYLLHLITVVSFIILFAISFVMVSDFRGEVFYTEAKDVEDALVAGNNESHIHTKTNNKPNAYVTKFYYLVIERWVGIENLVAVTSYPDKGWQLWHDAWNEEYQGKGTSMFDKKLLFSPYRNIDSEKHHFINTPGFIGFLYYPGSMMFLFIGVACACFFATVIEISAQRFSYDNMMFSSLIGLVIAYRFVHFGYVPDRSYLLFGTIVLNVIIIGLVNKMFFYSAEK